MQNKVAITGMGINSAIGMNVAENKFALQNCRAGLSRIELIDTNLKNKIFVGEIKKNNRELEKTLHLSDKNRFSRTAMLGAIAMQEAIISSGIKVKNNASLGFVNATTVGGMDMMERYFFEYLEEDAHRRYIEIHDTGMSTHILCDYFGFQGFSTTISTACSSAANAIILGSRMIESGQLKQVIVGGMDALSKFTINGFNSLMILSDDYNQPFDQNRKGLNLGEGAAYLVLESEASYTKRGKEPLAFLSGYANANDAHHQTATSEEGEGAYLAMKNALEKAGIQKEKIDYINAHGTATPNNDLTEGRAMVRLFGKQNVPEFSSTKPFTGHTLAAAGGVEAVYSILALQEGWLYPNLNFKSQMEEFDLKPNQKLLEKEVTTVLSNSFGFGGNCSSLIFEKNKG